MNDLPNPDGDPADPDDQFAALIRESGLLDIASDLIFEVQTPHDPERWQKEAVDLGDRVLHLAVDHAPDDLTETQVWLGAVRILACMLTNIAYSHLDDEGEEDQDEE
jgi:hypothetical protein